MKNIQVGLVKGFGSGFHKCQAILSLRMFETDWSNRWSSRNNRHAPRLGVWTKRNVFSTNGSDLSPPIIIVGSSVVISLSLYWMIKPCPFVDVFELTFWRKWLELFNFCTHSCLPELAVSVILLPMNPLRLLLRLSILVNSIFYQILIRRIQTFQAFHTNLWLRRGQSWFAEWMIR